MKKGYSSSKSKSAVRKAYMKPEIKPPLSLTEKDLPGLEKLSIDDECTLEVKVKLMSLSKSEYEDNPDLRGNFTIESVKLDNDGDD